MTAYQALINTARLQKGEKVLIHSAAGSTGQVAIWIAKLIGAEIFATVGVDDKKQLLINKFGIAADHIFYSRDTSFAKGVMRVIGSVGVDVVLNSLSGEMMQATWDCIAPYGRFIEIGKMDIGANAALPMGRFAKNVSFCALDLLHISQTNLGLTRQLIQSVMSLIAEGHAASPAPLHVYPLKDVEKAFRYMQSGKNTGRIIIDIDRQEVVPRLIRKKSTWRFDPQGSYVVVGGFGGLGRVILLWMVDKGAKYLIVPSRSGASSQAALDVISKVQRKGGQVVAPRCNVGSATELAALLQDCSNDIEMPPIKGCINSALDLQDAIFEGMTHTQWERSMRSKVDSSWNLHQQLPQDMDFLILLSSLAGIYGSPAQSNYAGGCTFQDALARYRTAICVGKTSVSLDLGWMRDAGIVAEREEYRRNRTNARDMNPVDAADLIAVLEVYCDPNLVIAGQKSQLLVVMTALIGRLARALGVAAEDIDERRPLSDYGVDSLMAVELRNWVRRDFSATVAVFEIVGSGASIAAIGALVVEKTEDIRAV
ncbi:KR domain-containing protein [Bombardia bombarda]|uniref:KR domain-containing protein n=1 Tax=Bombardia bombarda TaxID=252184 RepID=A0AA39WAE2_9PEZI|nr:KR domain-containing protein [Bombardia bombarda]